MGSNRQIKKLDALRRNYRAAFKSPAGKEVLKDLAQYCGEGRSDFHASITPIAMARNVGMRDVYLRIKTMLNYTDQDIWELFDNDRRERDGGDDTPINE